MERHATALQVAAAVAPPARSARRRCSSTTWPGRPPRSGPQRLRPPRRRPGPGRGLARTARWSGLAATGPSSTVRQGPHPDQGPLRRGGMGDRPRSLGVTDDPATFDELVVERFRRAGFVLMGKTTTRVRFGVGHRCRRTGITRNRGTPIAPRAAARRAAAAWPRAWRRSATHRTGRIDPHPGVVHRPGRPQAVRGRITSRLYGVVGRRRTAWSPATSPTPRRCST